MAKKHNQPSKPPAPSPGAPPPAPSVLVADVQAEGMVMSEVSQGTAPEPAAEPQPSAPKGKGKTRRYRVNWLFQGFRKDDLKLGDTVDCTEAEAAPYLGGVLSPDEDEA